MSHDPTAPARPDDDALASEYVLGVLDAAERTACTDRIERDPAFAALVAEWEHRLSGLNEDYAELPAPASAKSRIDERLFGGEKQPASGFWSSLAFWRTLSGAALAVAAALLVAIVIGGPAPRTSLIAALQAADTDVRFVALFDQGEGTLRVAQVGGDAPSGQAFELWLIAGDNPPASLGLIEGEAPPTSVAAGLVPGFSEGTALAVSLEPEGGSPTGAPTGPVVAQGLLKKI